MKLILKAQTINKEVDTLDGDAGEFIYDEDNKIIWKREMNYIYGIRTLEKITKIFEKLK